MHPVCSCVPSSVKFTLSERASQRLARLLQDLCVTAGLISLSTRSNVHRDTLLICSSSKCDKHLHPLFAGGAPCCIRRMERVLLDSHGMQVFILVWQVMMTGDFSGKCNINSAPDLPKKLETPLTS